jgi:hypothetical protein
MNLQVSQRMGDMRNSCNILARKYDGKRPFGNVGADEGILEWILKK